MTFKEFILGAERYAEAGYERGYKEGFARAEAIAKNEGFEDRTGMLVADLKAMREGSLALENEVEVAILCAVQDYQTTKEG